MDGTPFSYNLYSCSTSFGNSFIIFINLTHLTLSKQKTRKGHQQQQRQYVAVQKKNTNSALHTMFLPARSNVSLPVTPLDRRIHNVQWELPHYHTEIRKTPAREEPHQEEQHMVVEQCPPSQRSALGNVTNTCTQRKRRSLAMADDNRTNIVV